MTSSPMVSVVDVSNTFDGTPAVQTASFTVSEGEFCTLLGPSGCGKTTLLRMIAGFESPDSGDILIGGRSCVEDPPYRRDLAMVFQGYALFPHRTVLANVMFGLRMRRAGTTAEMKERTREALDLVGLSGFEERHPGQLSGGQQQRVALARAIVVRPKVLLLDEPLSALDLQLRKSMRYELKRLQDLTGITFVYVTHDQEEALSMSDQIVVINRGRVEQTGTPDQIYHRPATSFVASFIGESSLIPGRIAEIENDSVTIELDSPRICLRVSRDRLSSRAADVGLGDAVAISLHAEHALLSSGKAVGDVSLAGVVVQRSFLGAVTRYLVKPNDNDAVIVADSTEDFPVNARLHIGWRCEEITVVASR